MDMTPAETVTLKTRLMHSLGAIFLLSQLYFLYAFALSLSPVAHFKGTQLLFALAAASILVVLIIPLGIARLRIREGHAQAKSVVAVCAVELFLLPVALYLLYTRSFIAL